MYTEAATARLPRLAPPTPQHCPEGNVGPLSFVMSGAIASLLGTLVGGLAAIGGAWLQARSTARLQRHERHLLTGSAQSAATTAPRSPRIDINYAA